MSVERNSFREVFQATSASISEGLKTAGQAISEKMPTMAQVKQEITEGSHPDLSRAGAALVGASLAFGGAVGIAITLPMTFLGAAGGGLIGHIYGKLTTGESKAAEGAKAGATGGSMGSLAAFTLGAKLLTVAVKTEAKGFSEPEPTKSYEERLTNFTDGLTGLSGYDANLQKNNIVGLQRELFAGIEKTYKEKNTVTLDYTSDGKRGQDGTTWKNTGAKPKSFTVKQGDKKVEIPQKMLIRQQKEMKVRTVEGRCEETTVQRGFTEGVKEEEYESMEWRCTSSPTPYYADGNLNLLPEAVEIHTSVMSAEKAYKNPGLCENAPPDVKEKAAKAYSEKVAQQAKLFVKSAKEDGCNMIVDTGFGIGQFANPPADREVVTQAFVDGWVKTMVEFAINNPEIPIVFCAGGPHGEKVRKAIKEAINNHPAVKDNTNLQKRFEKQFVLSEKMGLDVALHGKKNEFKPSLRIAGDPSGVAGQNHTKLVKPTHTGPAPYQLAQEEQASGASTLMMQSIFGQFAKFFKVKADALKPDE